MKKKENKFMDIRLPSTYGRTYMNAHLRSIRQVLLSSNPYQI